MVGVEVLSGTVKTGISLMKKDAAPITTVKSIQHEKESISEAEKGKQVAISLPGVTCGRQIHGEEILYSDMGEENFRKLKDLKQYLTPDEKEILKEIAEIKRKNNSMWGI